MRTVALFDLDGTITKADTMLEFLAFHFGRGRLWCWLALVLPAWVLAKLGMLSSDAPKKALVRMAFGGKETTVLEQAAERFNEQRMPLLVRPAAMERLAQYRQAGTEVVIVTASCPLWVAPWCRQQGLSLLATGLAAEGGRFTGRLATPNCKGAEKVRRIRAYLGDTSGMVLHAYGDTPADRPMLAMAGESHYKPFR